MTSYSPAMSFLGGSTYIKTLMAHSIKRGKATPSRYRELSSDGITLEGNKLLRHRLPVVRQPITGGA